MYNFSRSQFHPQSVALHHHQPLPVFDQVFKEYDHPPATTYSSSTRMRLSLHPQPLQGKVTTENGCKVHGNADAFHSTYGIPSGSTIFTLLPGSRLQEVNRILSIYSKTINLLKDSVKDLTTIKIHVAPNLHVEDYIKRAVNEWHVPVVLRRIITYQLIRAARQSTDDISIYGFITSKPTWPSWMLTSAILLSLDAVTSIIPIKYIVELRMIFSIPMGIALGVFISVEYFLQATVLHILIVTTMVFASVFVVFTHLPSASSTKFLPWVFVLLVALFPVTYLLEGQVRMKPVLAESGVGDLGEEESKLTALLAVEGARTFLLGLYAAIFMLITLEIKFELASLMREKVNERGGRVADGRHDEEKIRVQLEENVLTEGPEPMEIDSKSSSSLIPNSGVAVLQGHASKHMLMNIKNIRCAGFQKMISGIRKPIIDTYASYENLSHVLYGFDLEDLLRASTEVLGKGTFGTTYKAVLEMGFAVAVKRLKDVTMGDKEFKEKIEDVGAMDNENLVPLRAYYCNGEEKLLVYDYMPMGSLSALLHGNRGAGRTPLNWETRSAIALGAARGITYLHAQGSTVSHGNIKSSNILLTTSYEARVSDFGLAQLVGPNATPTRVDGYRAPEVTDIRKVSQKADVYSFGVLLLELLTGKAPTHALLNEEGVDLPRRGFTVVSKKSVPLLK
ncbi:probable inactive receptor kinase RLK902 [Tanacetum coccineum]|uniref:Probable inactive receptor kinase RLK902 n=1 Tax=Tanacetum coccineum TaxID=301880 RepID=A0ABQ4WUV4_9ASTR